MPISKLKIAEHSIIEYNRPTTAEEHLRWLRRIRWGAFIGHWIVLVAVSQFLDLSLDPAPFLIMQSVIAVTNIALHSEKSVVAIRVHSLITIALLIDICLLTFILYSYGGYANPFSMMYLVQVVLAAFMLGPLGAWIMATIACVSYGLLFRWYVPVAGLSMQHMGSGTGFNIHLHGMLLAFVLISLLIAGFVSKMRSAVEQREREISKMRAIEERLISLTQLAAGVAHELGTPLGTAMIAASELKESYRDLTETEVLTQLQTTIRELMRCREILGRMRADGQGTPVSKVTHYKMDDIIASLRTNYISRNLDLLIDEPGMFINIPLDSLIQTLNAVVDNAFDASAEDSQVKIRVMGEGEKLTIEVSDSGVGMDALTLNRAGEPFFTTKPPGKGTGLGLFLSRLTIERLGGELRIDSKVETGTRVTMIFPESVKWNVAA